MNSNSIITLIKTYKPDWNFTPEQEIKLSWLFDLCYFSGAKNALLAIKKVRT